MQNVLVSRKKVIYITNILFITIINFTFLSSPHSSDFVSLYCNWESFISKWEIEDDAGCRMQYIDCCRYEQA